jgi:hypothetical protein
MDITKKFTSNENKGFIWKLMCDEKLFTDIPDNKSLMVKNAFDLIVETISNKITPQDSLINLNKHVISEMISKITNYTSPSQLLSDIDSSSMTLNYNAAEISKTRQTKFQNEFTNKKQEFDKFNNVPVPEKIDFSDNLDSPIGSELDKMLAEQIAMREKQLNMVLQTQDKNAANEWIQNPGVKIPDTIKDENIKYETIKHENIKIKIGESIQELKFNEPVKTKKVNFMDNNNISYSKQSNENENENFLSLLKKKEEYTIKNDTNDTNETISMLKEILKNQNLILQLLTTNTKQI